MLRAAARRFLLVLAGASAGTAVVSLLAGLALGAGLLRSVAVGYYLVGCFLLVSGFFLGNRGPMRITNEESLVGLRRPRHLRAAGLSEQRDSMNGSALMVLIGLLLLVLAVAVDPRVRLV